MVQDEPLDLELGSSPTGAPRQQTTSSDDENHQIPPPRTSGEQKHDGLLRVPGSEMTPQGSSLDASGGTIKEQPSSQAMAPAGDEESTKTSDAEERKSSQDSHDDVVVVSWDGDDDPYNPKNWPSNKQLLNVSIVSLIGFLTPLASSISSPGAASILAEFNSDNQLFGAIVTSIYVLGNAIGPLLLAPASELWGRLILYHICNVTFCAFTLGCALSTSLPMLIVFRFLAGCAGAGPLAIGGGTIGDMIPQAQRGKFVAIFSAGGLIGPIVGPIAGGFLTEGLGWRWSFWIVLIAGGATTIVSFICLQETFGAVLLKRKAARLRKQSPRTIFKVDGVPEETPMAVFKRSLVRPIKMLFLSPVIFILAVFQALSFGYMYLLFTTFPSVFEDQYGFTTGTSGLVFIGFGLGCIVGLAIILSQSDKMVRALAAKSPDGQAKPEVRLIFMTFGVPFLTIGLFWYGWSAQAGTQWIVPIIGTFVLALGSMAVSLPGNLYIIDCYTIYSASGLAAMTTLRYIFGGVLPLAGTPMYDALGVGWGNSLLGFIALPFCLAPPLLIANGEKLRNRFPLSL